MLKKEQLKSGEVVVHVQRQAFVYQVPRILIALAFMLIPLGFLFRAVLLGWYGMAPLCGLVGLGLLLLLRARASWLGTGCVITTQRIFHYHQRGFLQQEARIAALGAIRDVGYRIHGVFGSMLRLGVVRVRFRGVTPSMRFERMHHPEQLDALLRELRSLPEASGGGDAQFTRVSLKEMDA